MPALSKSNSMDVLSMQEFLVLRKKLSFLFLLLTQNSWKLLLQCMECVVRRSHGTGRSVGGLGLGMLETSIVSFVAQWRWFYSTCHKVEIFLFHQTLKAL
jgi:hypothetical protein